MDDEELVERLRLGPDDGRSLALRLRDRIEQLIDEGHLPHGRRLPPERHLAQALAVSRPTVRLALDGLERRGSVVRRQGSGTYVSGAKVQGSLDLLMGLSDDLARTRRTSRTKVLQFGFCAPDAGVQSALEVEPDALSTVRLIRVRYIDDIASTYEISWMPARIAGHLVGRDLRDASLFRLLAETADIHPHHGSERLRAGTLGVEEAAELECAVGTACFLVNRTTYDNEDRPIEYATTLLRGDRFFYASALRAPGDRPDAAGFEALPETSP